MGVSANTIVIMIKLGYSLEYHGDILVSVIQFARQKCANNVAPKIFLLCYSVRTRLV